MRSEAKAVDCKLTLEDDLVDLQPAPSVMFKLWRAKGMTHDAGTRSPELNAKLARSAYDSTISG